MNDFDNKGGASLDISSVIEDSSTVAKPKMVLKDSSKYVKKAKPSQKQVTPSIGTPVHSQTPVTPVPLGNLMQSVQEGLSQILNPAQTFYSNGNVNSNGMGGNNTSSSGNSGAPDPHKQTPTFTQHMSKIIIKELDGTNNVAGNNMSSNLSRKRSSVNFEQ
jgi:hypothetical protein